MLWRSNRRDPIRILRWIIAFVWPLSCVIFQYLLVLWQHFVKRENGISRKERAVAGERDECRHQKQTSLTSS
jgi:hypothetical protein